MKTIEVEVVYALPALQDSTRVRLPEHSTAGDAVAASRVTDRHPELGIGVVELAIWGRIVPTTARVRDRDRVEICRPLTADPKTARRRRATRPRS